MPDRLAGIYTPNIVPLDREGRIDEDELRRYVDWLIARGVHGLYPNGSTGEFLRFTTAERRRTIEIVCSQAAGRVPVLAGAAEANVTETLRACETYAGLGARAVAIVAPFYYKLSGESVFAYFREIARQSPIDVTLYNIPIFASPIDVATARRLAEFDRIVGIKDSSGDISHMLRMMAAIKPVRPEFVFFTGWEAALAPMLAMGCDGGVNATSGVVPELTRSIYETVRAGGLEEARRMQFQLNELFDAMVEAPQFPEGFRIGVELRGFRMGTGRQPLSELQQTECGRLRETLRMMLAKLGFDKAASPA